MKTLRVSLIISIFLLVFKSQLFAQCSLLSPGVELNSLTTSGPNCVVNLNLRFTIDRNNGNKYTYVHLWKQTQHPNIGYAKGPDAGELGPVLATIAIVWDGANVASLMPAYSADNSVTPLFAGVSISQENTGSLYTVSLSSLSFPIQGACTAIPALSADVWGTQANSNKPTVHCVNADPIPLVIANPLVSGLINCSPNAGPRTYNLDVTTTDTAPFDVTYKLFLDDGVLTGGVTSFTSADQLIFTSGVISLSASTPIDINNALYSYAANETQRTVWVEVSGPTLPNVIIAEIENICDVALPVKLAKFKGDLLDNTVSLSWVTTEEYGSAKFGVERSSDMKEFVSIGEILAAGNSKSNQNYQFLDLAPVSGNNYYRLKQLDLDGRFEYSRTISVANSEKTVAFELLGNPVQHGEIRFLLKNQDPTQVQLTNLKGESVKFSLVKEGNVYMVKPQAELGTGLYLLSLKSRQGHITKKVMSL